MAKLTRREALALAGLSAAGPLAAAVAQSPTDGRYLILSCDGGGIRGLLTARIIQRLEKQLQLEAGFSLLGRINLFAGTSTGGIIALGLANDVKIDELVKLYRTRGAEIFPKSAPALLNIDLVKSVLSRHDPKAMAIVEHVAGSTRELFHPKYSNEPLKGVLKGVLGKETLGTVKTGKSVMVTTLRLSSESDSGEWAPMMLHNVGPDVQKKDTRVADRPRLSTTLVDAALCTSAAPLYFPPYKLKDLGYCVDGGMFANCPASMAMALALRETNGVLEKVRILSIGTGSQVSGIDVPHSKPFEDAADYGAMAWLDPVARGIVLKGGERLTPKFPLLSALFDASSASHNYICMQAMGPDRYHRVHVNLPKPIALDETDSFALASLEESADNIPKEEWDETVQWVKRHFG